MIPGSHPARVACKIFCIDFFQLFELILRSGEIDGSGSFGVSGGVVGRLGFRVGVSASYSYFRRVRNFDFVYTAAVSYRLRIILICWQFDSVWMTH